MSKVLEKFVEYQAQLLDSVEQNDACLGLMFAGSAADLSRVDEHSDQDFFLVVKDGMAESFRRDLSWLPNSQNILLSPRETQHGLKVLYRDGTLLEFAVFEQGELESHTAPADNRVAFDRGGVAKAISSITFSADGNGFDDSKEYQLFLTLLLIGAGRVKRGEIIAGAQHIKSYAVSHLLGLVRSHWPMRDSSADVLNRFRRFEQDYPELGHQISQLVEGPSLSCALGLLKISEQLPIASDFEEARELVLEHLVG